MRRRVEMSRVEMSRMAMPASARRVFVAMLWALVVGCSSIPRSRVEPSVTSGRPAATPETRAAVDPDGGFTLAASMLDTWNAVGQLLVRLDGVAYEGRAQMLGIYVVRYRGERFLILTRALVMRTAHEGMVTRVGAVLPDGRPNDSAAALELLGVLQRRLPSELARIRAEG